MRGWKNHIQGDTDIFIAINTMLDPLDEEHDYARYNILHGRRSSCDGGLMTSHYITGKDEYGRTIGFKSLDDVQLFIEQEIEECKKLKRDYWDMKKNNPECRYQTIREEIVVAWTFFYNNFTKAKNTGKIITWEEAQEMYKEEVA